MSYRLLVTLALTLHFGFLAYLVLGGFIAWRWPRTIWPHLATAGWAVLVVAARLACPLTHLEHWARRRAGESGVGQGFIDRYIEGVVYPERYAGLAQTLVAVLILVSWLGLAHRLGLFRRLRPAHRLDPAQDSGPAPRIRAARHATGPRSCPPDRERGAPPGPSARR
ncbi:DUF2784 domain-containing protein [Micromonospora sp. WMMD1102]|uniref:DUF2784 domain-containing protein n=1 Tax=Micromonospora sp. WMMD1102 TaxID=3016105 RepID=UPI002414FEB8|nr:DUF2784 domain-containing protein [Micromonospora sp. WMMD1102]MDG4785722.1 DUF2784 domain-containing protein [Micromonospora sp. WMMD1102]